MLGAIKGVVSNPQDGVAGGAILREDSGARRECHCLKCLTFELDVDVPGMLAQPFGALARHVPGCIRQDNDEFITAVTAGNVLPADMPEKQLAQFT